MLTTTLTASSPFTREQLRLIVSEQIDDFGQLGCAKQRITLFVRQNSSGLPSPKDFAREDQCGYGHGPAAAIWFPWLTQYRLSQWPRQLAELESDHGSFMSPERAFEVDTLEHSRPGYPLIAVS